MLATMLSMRAGYSIAVCSIWLATCTSNLVPVILFPFHGATPIDLEESLHDCRQDEMCTLCSGRVG